MASGSASEEDAEFLGRVLRDFLLEFTRKTKKKRPMGSGALSRQCRVREIMPTLFPYPTSDLPALT